MQRLEPVAGRGPTHADWHQAVIGPRDRCKFVCQLYEVLRSQDHYETVRAASATASLPLELAVPTLTCHPQS